MKTSAAITKLELDNIKTSLSDMKRDVKDLGGKIDRDFKDLGNRIDCDVKDLGVKMDRKVVSIKGFRKLRMLISHIV